MILTLKQSIRSNILNIDKPYFMLLNGYKIRKTKFKKKSSNKQKVILMKNCFTEMEADYNLIRMIKGWNYIIYIT